MGLIKEILSVLLIVLCLVVVESGKLKEKSWDYEATVEGQPCSLKEIRDRKKTISVLDVVIQRKLRDFERLENRRQKLMKLLRKLCRESKTFSSKIPTNKIYIQFIGERNDSTFKQILVSDREQQIDLIRKVIEEVDEKKEYLEKLPSRLEAPNCLRGKSYDRYLKKCVPLSEETNRITTSVGSINENYENNYVPSLTTYKPEDSSRIVIQKMPKNIVPSSTRPNENFVQEQPGISANPIKEVSGSSSTNNYRPGEFDSNLKLLSEKPRMEMKQDRINNYLEMKLNPSQSQKIELGLNNNNRPRAQSKPSSSNLSIGRPDASLNLGDTNSRTQKGETNFNSYTPTEIPNTNSIRSEKSTLDLFLPNNELSTKFDRNSGNEITSQLKPSMSFDMNQKNPSNFELNMNGEIQRPSTQKIEISENNKNKNVDDKSSVSNKSNVKITFDISDLFRNQQGIKKYTLMEILQKIIRSSGSQIISAGSGSSEFKFKPNWEDIGNQVFKMIQDRGNSQVDINQSSTSGEGGMVVSNKLNSKSESSRVKSENDNSAYLSNNINSNSGRSQMNEGKTSFKMSQSGGNSESSEISMNHSSESSGSSVVTPGSESEMTMKNVVSSMVNGGSKMTLDSKSIGSIISQNLGKNQMSMNGSSITITDKGLKIISNQMPESSYNRTLKITSFYPEIEFPDGSSNVKLNPVKISSSESNMNQLIMKISNLAKNGKTGDILTLIQNSPELRGRFSFKTEEGKQKPEKITVSSILTSPTEAFKSVTKPIEIVDEGEIPIMNRDDGKMEMKIGTTKFSTLKPTNLTVDAKKLTPKFVIKATLPDGKTIKIDERNLPENFNPNDTKITLDKLGLDLKNVSMSNILRNGLKSLNLEVQNAKNSTLMQMKPDGMKIEVKKIKPVKFVHRIPAKFSRRTGVTEEGTTTKLPSTTTKVDTTTTTTTTTETPTTTKVESTTTKKNVETTAETKIFSNMFKPIKDKIKENKNKIHRILGMNDQDHKKIFEIPASGKEDIDKIIKLKAPKMEFKSVMGKTLEDLPFGMGKMMDEHESTKAMEVTTTTPVESSTTEASQVTSPSNNLLLLPLKIIKGSP